MNETHAGRKHRPQIMHVYIYSTLLQVLPNFISSTAPSRQRTKWRHAYINVFSRVFDYMGKYKVAHAAQRINYRELYKL